MAAKAFLDTNIVLRLLNDSLPQHSAVQKLVNEVRNAGHELWISRQVIREYLVQVTRPGFLERPLSVEQIVIQVETLRTLFKIADDTHAVTDRLMDLLKETPFGGKQIHDANIIATMLVYEINILLTMNVSDMKRFTGRIKLLSPD